MDGLWSEYTRRAIGLTAVGAFVLVVYAARGVLAPLIMAIVLAFLIEPLVSYLNRRLRVPRAIAGLVVLVLLLALFLLVVMVLAPILVDQFSQVRFNVGDAVGGALEWLRTTSESLRSLKVGGYELGLGPYVDSFQAKLEPSAVVDFLPSGQDLFGSIDSILSTTAGALAGFASSLGRLLLTLFLTLIYSLYLVSDGPRLASSAWALVPSRHRPELEELQGQVVRVWRAFFRGQLLMVTLFGLSVGLVMWGLGLPSALIVGIMAGVMDLVPSIGALVAGGLAVLMALIQGSEHLGVGNLAFALIVLGCYLGLQQVESSVLQPRIMGRSVELPGIVIIVGIMAGASVAGILGAYLAVPVMATARVVGLYVHRKLTERHGPEEPGPATEPSGRGDQVEETEGGASADPVAAVQSTDGTPVGTPEGPELEGLAGDPPLTVPETGV